MSEVPPQDLYDRLYRGNPSLVKTRDFEDVDVRTNNLIFAFLVLVNLYQFFIAPLLLSITPWFMLTLLPTLLFSSTTGVMVHEAIHGLLHSDARRNRRMGQVMAVFMGIAYDLQRFDHLRHHRISRTENDCDEIYISPQTVLHSKIHSIGVHLCSGCRVESRLTFLHRM